ncbi:MAG: hypothetical protein ACREF3_05815, partial [Acetobacteraceae bacterium]
RTSLDIARRQGAALTILKSAFTLTEFLRRSERRQEAREVLEAGLAALPEGRDAADAQRAQQLLERLSEAERNGEFVVGEG